MLAETTNAHASQHRSTPRCKAWVVPGLAATVAVLVLLAGVAAGAAQATIAGRHIFYNDSAFDANDPAPGPADDWAVAPDKTALLPDQTATFDNYTSYSRGINGVMIDIANLPEPLAPLYGCLNLTRLRRGL